MYDTTEANREVNVQLQLLLTCTAPRWVISFKPRPLYVEERHDIQSMQYYWAPKRVWTVWRSIKFVASAENPTLIGGVRQARRLVTRCNR